MKNLIFGIVFLILVFSGCAGTKPAQNSVAGTQSTEFSGGTSFDTALSKSPYARALIIEDDDIPVGFALLSFSHATEAGGLVVLLEDLYISETCRGKGLGSKFMQFMEQEYPEARRFRLEVTKANLKAIGLYSSLGYKTLDYVQMVKDM